MVSMEDMFADSKMSELSKLVFVNICDETFKNELVKALNDAIDIPFINEKTEGKILYAFCDVVESVIREKCKKMV